MRKVKNILIVDDNKIILSLSEKQLKLKDDSLNITTIDDGGKAMDTLDNNLFDVILLDLRMPKVSGLDIAKHLREGGGSNKDTPIVALTADVSAKSKEECREAGINSIMSKPFEINDLINEIDRIYNEK